MSSTSMIMTIKVMMVMLSPVSACTTDYGRGAPCRLPYKLGGEVHFSCTTRPLHSLDTTSGLAFEPVLPPHCPTVVDNLTLEASRLVRCV